MNKLQQLTNEQLNRLYRCVWRRLQRVYAGGTSFGIDMPTLWAVTPGFAQIIVDIRAEAIRRKELGLV